MEREDRWGKESGRGRRKEKICNEEKFFFSGIGSNSERGGF